MCHKIEYYLQNTSFYSSFFFVLLNSKCCAFLQIPSPGKLMSSFCGHFGVWSLAMVHRKTSETLHVSLIFLFLFKLYSVCLVMDLRFRIFVALSKRLFVVFLSCFCGIVITDLTHALYIMPLLPILMFLFLQMMSCKYLDIRAAFDVWFLTSSLRFQLFVMFAPRYLKVITCSTLWL